MAYHIYHTRGIILGSQPAGEANRFYKIFTEELGLIRASAQSVREGKSKLRYVLQDFSLIHVDLIRGKEIWRITSAIEEQPLDIIGSEDQKKLFTHACSFAARLLQGEGREKALFQDLRGLADFLMREVVPKELLQTTESLLFMRALTTLGYIDASSFMSFLKHGEFSLELIVQLKVILPTVLQAIDEALIASHL